MGNKDSLQSGALTLKNIGIIDQVANMIENEISDSVFSQLERSFKQRVPSDWKSEFHAAKSGRYSEDETWCAPNS